MRVVLEGRILHFQQNVRRADPKLRSPHSTKASLSRNLSLHAARFARLARTARACGSWRAPRRTGGLLEGALPNCVAAPCVDGLPLPSDRSDDNCTSLTFGELCRNDEGTQGRGNEEERRGVEKHPPVIILYRLFQCHVSWDIFWVQEHLGFFRVFPRS